MEEYPPSFFELVAQETLSDVVRPALKYILSIAAENYQSIYLRLFNSYDEIYLLLSLAVDSFYLKKYKGTFAENFYGIKRIGKSNLKWELLAAVVIPYLSSKLTDYYEFISQGGPSGIPIQDTVDIPVESYPTLVIIEKKYLKDTLRKYNCFEIKDLPKRIQFIMFLSNFTRRAFCKTYPYFYFLTNTISLIYQLRYLIGSSPFWSLSMQLLKKEFAYITPEEMNQMDKPLFKSHSLPYRLISACLDGVKFGLPFSIFVLKFIDWWNTSGYSAQYRRAIDESSLDANSIAIADIPPPEYPDIPTDPLIIKHNGIVSLPKNPSVCPLCCRKRKDSCLFINSGFVFCYPCIIHHLRIFKKCPVTGIPVNIADGADEEKVEEKIIESIRPIYEHEE